MGAQVAKAVPPRINDRDCGLGGHLKRTGRGARQCTCRHSRSTTKQNFAAGRATHARHIPSTGVSRSWSAYLIWRYRRSSIALSALGRTARTFAHAASRSG